MSWLKKNMFSLKGRHGSSSSEAPFPMSSGAAGASSSALAVPMREVLPTTTKRARSHLAARPDGENLPRGLTLLHRDRPLRPERVLPTARIAADSSRDERVAPGSERACAREPPRGNDRRQPLPRAPVEDQPGRLAGPRDRAIDQLAADLLPLILRLHEDEPHELAGI